MKTHRGIVIRGCFPTVITSPSILSCALPRLVSDGVTVRQAAYYIAIVPLVGNFNGDDTRGNGNWWSQNVGSIIPQSVFRFHTISENEVVTGTVAGNVWREDPVWRFYWINKSIITIEFKSFSSMLITKKNTLVQWLQTRACIQAYALRFIT